MSKYYPFIRDLSGSHFSVDHSLFDFAGDLCDNTMLISHNNHFGHFIGDDLPLILLSRLSPIKFPLNLLGLGQIPSGILSNLRLLISPSSVIQSYPISKSSFFNCPNYISYTLSNPIARSFLLYQFLHSQRVCLPLTKSYIVLREGHYASRVMNYNEIRHLAVSNGFIPIDSTLYSLDDLINLLSDAKTVICESGSTTLLVSICCNHRTRIISLQPDLLFKTPSPDMLESGLPYVLSYHPNVRVVLVSTLNPIFNRRLLLPIHGLLYLLPFHLRLLVYHLSYVISIKSWHHSAFTVFRVVCR